MNNLVHAAAAVFQMKAGKRVLIAAHGNSLRGIVKHLDGISDEDIMGLNLPTGIPFVYELDENFKPVVSMKVRSRGYTVLANFYSDFTLIIR